MRDEAQNRPSRGESRDEPTRGETRDQPTAEAAVPEEAGQEQPSAEQPGEGGQPLAGELIEQPPAGRTRELLARLLERPSYAPELLALAAVEILGPGAQRWVRQTRADYPNASPDGLTRLATRRHVRLGLAGGAFASMSGIFVPLAELVAAAWTQAGLALHVAACHGEDPTDPERAVELLVLAQVHADEEAARAALTAALDPAGPEQGLAVQRLAEVAWRLVAPVNAQAGGWLVLTLANRVLPGARSLAIAAGGSAAVQRMAARAVARYRAAGR